MQNYIFDTGTSNFFYEKLNCFLDYYADKVLLSGLCENNSKLSEIKFTQNVSNEKIYYNFLLDCLQAEPAFCSVQLLNGKRLEMDCYYFNLGDLNGVSYIYMMNNIMDWTSENNFCCQIWEIIDINEKEILEFWTQ